MFLRIHLTVFAVDLHLRRSSKLRRSFFLCYLSLRVFNISVRALKPRVTDKIFINTPFYLFWYGIPWPTMLIFILKEKKNHGVRRHFPFSLRYSTLVYYFHLCNIVGILYNYGVTDLLKSSLTEFFLQNVELGWLQYEAKLNTALDQG